MLCSRAIARIRSAISPSPRATTRGAGDSSRSYRSAAAFVVLLFVMLRLGLEDPWRIPRIDRGAKAPSREARRIGPGIGDNPSETNAGEAVGQCLHGRD